ncbi:MAG: hydantoinase/oxoprolinase family protein [Sphingosinicella sp.]|nr:hydantoinase/oxoprolinase family protein [Sphingosinicella sp.]
MSGSGYRLGIDVGGTNTDAVLMRGREVLATAKSFTTADVRSGVVNAVRMILDKAPEHRAAIEAVMIGTTQFVNAFVQRKGLAPVAIFRVSLPKADGVPPLAGWPDDLVEVAGSHIYMVGGGALYTGKDYAPLDEDALRAAAEDARAKGLKAVAISANFAPIRPDIEEKAAAVVQAVMPEARITLSSKVGGLGLIDRENAAVINATLAELSEKVIGSLQTAIADLEINAPIYISQNDGTLITTETASAFPILTCSAGPTNSIRGAAFLTGLDEAVVADIGGTTTDIGFLLRGFPRETTAANYIGGVRTNFRMPDVLSIGIGGGSLVRKGEKGWTVGPESVGFRLAEEGLIFGGETLTASDIAVRAGQAEIGDPAKVAHLPDEAVEAALDNLHLQIEDAIDQIKTSNHPLPLVLVGGGSILVSRQLKGTSEVLKPAHAEVANAVGAAIALVSGRVDKLYDVGTLGREAALEQARKEATDAAVAAGAREGEVEIVEIIELPMTHMKSGSVQIRVRAVGPLAALA